MTDGSPIGPVIDGLGINVDIRPDQLVAGAVVLVKVIDPDGAVRLAFGWSDGMSWLERIGIMRAAERMDLPRAEGPASDE